MFGQLCESSTGLLAVSCFVNRISWFLALAIVASWASCACYYGLYTFSDLALVYFIILPVRFCLQSFWTEDTSLT